MWMTVLHHSLFGMVFRGLCVWFNGILFCFSQAQITVNGNSGTAASPVSHFQRPFSPSSAYPPPASLNSNIVIMQHGRMMGKPCTECLLYTLRNVFQFMWPRLQTIAKCFTSIMKVLSIHLLWELNAKNNSIYW